MKLDLNHDSTEQIHVRISGEMDALGCAEARPALEQLATEASDREVVIDLEGVSFLDSSGVGAIVFLYKRLRAGGGNLKVANVLGQPRELLKLLRIDQAIEVDWQFPASAGSVTS